MCPRGELSSLKDLHVRSLWLQLKADENFREVYRKRVPPRCYFWPVFGVLYPADFYGMMQAKLSTLKVLNKVKSEMRTPSASTTTSTSLTTSTCCMS